MGLLRWWRRRAVWEKVLLIGVPGVGLGVGGAFLIRRSRRLPPFSGGFTPYEELPDLLDYEVDEVDEEEPSDIQYDPYDAPCVELDEPAPVAAGLESEAFCTPPADLEPKQKTEVTFAQGGDRPKWPISTSARRKLQVSYQDVRGKWHGRWGRHFGASRKSKKTGSSRRHVGVDLFADPGDVVLATEGGEIIAGLPFYKGTGAVYLLTDSGIILNYGELERNSWRDYGVRAGDRVEAGDKIGRVGLSTDGSHMLHLETYEPEVTLQQIRRGDMQWWKGDPSPEGILDPSRYLVRAQRVHHEDEVAQV